jgi:hypothetical protein
MMAAAAIDRDDDLPVERPVERWPLKGLIPLSVSYETARRHAEADPWLRRSAATTGRRDSRLLSPGRARGAGSVPRASCRSIQAAARFAPAAWLWRVLIGCPTKPFCGVDEVARKPCFLSYVTARGAERRCTSCLRTVKSGPEEIPINDVEDGDQDDRLHCLIREAKIVSQSPPRPLLIAWGPAARRRE